PSFFVTTAPSGSARRAATRAATTTPPRGMPSTAAGDSIVPRRTVASWSPASSRSRNGGPAIAPSSGVASIRAGAIACALVHGEEADPMVHAYVLIQTEVGKAAAVAAEVRSVPGVTEAEDVTGPYDVIVRAEAETVDDLGKLVVARIQSVEGITRTLTCPVVHI